MSKFRKISNIAKMIGISTVAGFAGARIASTPAEAGKNSTVGAATGFALGSATMLAPKVFKSTIVRDTAKFVFRRIRGKIIPIRVKK